MRIAVISHAYLAPESRRSIEALASSAELVLLLPDRWPGPAGDYRAPAPASAPAGVGYTVLPRRHVTGQQYLLAGLKDALREIAPDVLLVEYEPWSLMLWQARRAIAGSGTKLVAFPKKNTLSTRPRATYLLKRLIGRPALAACAHVFCASVAVAELMRSHLRVPPARLSTAIHIGVDTARFAPDPGRTPDRVIGYCGMLGHRKGVDLLVAAVAAARRTSGADLRLRLLGAPDGTLDPALWQGHDWLEIQAWTDQGAVAGFLRDLDIFVLPARRLPDHEEHDGHALMEAMACGCACIATSGGIVPELLGDAGVLVAEAEVDALARAVTVLAGDELRRAQFGEAARQRALARFDNAVVAAEKLRRLQEMTGD